MVKKLDVLQYGWDTKNGILSPTTTTQEPIPNDLRELLDLFCFEKKCDSLKCLCVKEGIFCSTACKCSQLCQNICNQRVSDESGDEESADF